MIEIYTENIFEYDDEELFGDMLDTLPEYRKQKIRSIDDRVSALQSLTAGLLLKRGLFEVGIDDTEVWNSATRFGKPIGKAQYPPECAGRDIYFSLSHSGEYAACVIADMPVGCDIEMISDKDKRVAKRALSEKEYAYYMSLENPGGGINEYLRQAQQEFFFKVWTIKESAMKAEGKGFALGLSNVEIDHDDKTVLVSGSGRYGYETYTDRIPGYVFSICTLQ